MSIKPDKWIRRMALEHKIIEPFEDTQVREGTISYGVSAYGYDMRLADEFKIGTKAQDRMANGEWRMANNSNNQCRDAQLCVSTNNQNNSKQPALADTPKPKSAFENVQNISEITIIDPKNIPDHLFTSIKCDVLELPPASFALGKSVEYFRIPRDILAICTGKSTYARCGIIVNVTPLEPEWEGYVTIAISNISSNTVKIYASEGIAQVIFLSADEVCEISYKDKKGKYQAQKDITTAKV